MVYQAITDDDATLICLGGSMRSLSKYSPIYSDTGCGSGECTKLQRFHINAALFARQKIQLSHMSSLFGHTEPSKKFQRASVHPTVSVDRLGDAF
ncbi:hypothetical protein Plhal304r1_c015g0056521 [Plasmopara halstedii]